MTSATWALILFCLGMITLHAWLLWEQARAFRELVSTLDRLLNERDWDQGTQEELRVTLAEVKELLR